MRAAMIRGGPDPTQIIFKARILPATATSEDTLAPGSQANPNSKLSHGPYRRYQIDIAADSRPILFTKTSDGIYHSRLELRVYVYDQDGALIIDSLAASQSDITPELLKQILAGRLSAPPADQRPRQRKLLPAHRPPRHHRRPHRRHRSTSRFKISNLPPLSAPATPAAAPK